jgi:peptidoglycan/LPS O-acetylase OafA/YrhL
LLVVAVTYWTGVAYFTQSTSYSEALRLSLTLGKAPSVLWTIPVELTFYVYLPFILRMVLRMTKSPLGAMSLSAGFATWCVAIAAARNFFVPPSFWMTLGFHHYANSFVGGVLLYALLHNDHLRFPGSGRRIAQIAPLILILAYPIFSYSFVRHDYFMTELNAPTAWRSYYDHIFPFAPIVISGVIYGLLHPAETALSRAMRTRLLRRIGEWSFGVYLIHIPMVIVLRTKFGDGQFSFIISIAATFAIAALLSKYVERPAIRFGRGIGRLVLDRLAPEPTVRPAESMGA